MRWFKVAAIAIAFLVVSSVIRFFMEAAIAVLILATVVLAVKVCSTVGRFRGTGATEKSAGPGTAVHCPVITGGTLARYRQFMELNTLALFIGSCARHRNY
jgi:hypothetical protein